MVTVKYCLAMLRIDHEYGSKSVLKVPRYRDQH